MAATFPSGGLCDTYGNPEDFHGRTKGPIDRAKSICRACPVRRDCLMWALEHGPSGTWGGFTDRERTQHGAALLRRIPA